MSAQDETFLPLSALQHLLFCERQCALIHIEQVWEENRLTAEGRVMHDKAHAGGCETRREVRTATALRLRSLRLGLTGQADIVEFHRVQAGGVALPSAAGLWQPFPVEYKRGKPKAHRADEVQLCAQALCLEEMLNLSIPAGALFYGQTRRRLDVAFDLELRDLTVSAATRLHQLIERGETPPAEYDQKKCDACSLLEICQPRACVKQHSARQYLNSVLPPPL